MDQSIFVIVLIIIIIIALFIFYYYCKKVSKTSFSGQPIVNYSKNFGWEIKDSSEPCKIYEFSAKISDEGVSIPPSPTYNNYGYTIINAEIPCISNNMIKAKEVVRVCKPPSYTNQISCINSEGRIVPENTEETVLTSEGCDSKRCEGELSLLMFNYNKEDPMCLTKDLVMEECDFENQDQYFNIANDGMYTSFSNFSNGLCLSMSEETSEFKDDVCGGTFTGNLLEFKECNGEKEWYSVPSSISAVDKFTNIQQIVNIKNIENLSSIINDELYEQIKDSKSIYYSPDQIRPFGYTRTPDNDCLLERSKSQYISLNDWEIDFGKDICDASQGIMLNCLTIPPL